MNPLTNLLNGRCENSKNLFWIYFSWFTTIIQNMGIFPTIFTVECWCFSKNLKNALRKTPKIRFRTAVFYAKKLLILSLLTRVQYQTGKVRIFYIRQYIDLSHVKKTRSRICVFRAELLLENFF